MALPTNNTEAFWHKTKFRNYSNHRRPNPYVLQVPVQEPSINPSDFSMTVTEKKLNESLCPVLFIHPREFPPETVPRTFGA